MASILKVKDKDGNIVDIPVMRGEQGPQGAQGPKGDKGDTGPYFTPAVSAEGILSWSNNGGLDNPASVDLATAVINALPNADGTAY